MFNPAISNVAANNSFKMELSIIIKEKMIEANILPSMEKPLKTNESLKVVLFCRKYVIKPAKEEKRIIKVLVSTATLIGIKKRRVIIDTKKTPPPIPAIAEIAPDSSPSISNKEIRKKDNSIGKLITHLS